MLDKQAPRRTESGASSVEYGLVAVAIAALIAVVVFSLGRVTQESYGDSCETFRSQAAPSAEQCSTE